MQKKATSSNSSIINRVVARLMICIAAISLLGFFIWQKADNSLNEALERSLSMQTDTLAHSLGQQFRQELSDMQHASLLVSNGRLSSNVLVDSFGTMGQEGVFSGIEKMDDLMSDEAEDGRLPFKDDFRMMSNIPDGKPVVTYWEGHGLVFATPIIDESTGDVSSIFYRLYDNDAAMERFNILSCDGEGSAALFDGTGLLTPLTMGREDSISIKRMCRDTEVIGYFQQLGKAVQDDRGSTMQVNHQQTNYFLSVAHVPDTEFFVMGYVPVATVAAEHHALYLILLIAFGFALGFIIFTSMYIFNSFKEKHELKATNAPKRNVAAVIHHNEASASPINNENEIAINTINTVNSANDVDYSQEPEPEPEQAPTLLHRLKPEAATPAVIDNPNESFGNSENVYSMPREKFKAPDARILVVDDTAMNLTVVKGLLRKTQIQVDTADNGEDGLKLVQTNKYDIVFIDYRMPDMDGVETLHRIKEMTEYPNSGTPMVALVSNVASEARDEAIAGGFDDCLTKPIHSDHLETLILKYLPKKKVSTETSSEEDDRELAWLDSIPRRPKPEETEPTHIPEEKQEQIAEAEQVSVKPSEQEHPSEQKHDPDPEHEKSKNLKDAYEAMRSAAAAKNLESLEFVLKALSEYKFSPKERKHYKAIKKAASIPDWGKINELLRDKIQD